MILVRSSEVDTKASKLDTKKETRKTARRCVQNGGLGDKDATALYSAPPDIGASQELLNS